MIDGLKVVSTFPFSLSSQAVLREAAQRDVICIASKEWLRTRLRDAEILCAYELPDDWRELAPNLRWMQVAGAGVDTLRATGILEEDSGILVTTAVGINATTIAEYVFGSILMFNRNWPEMVRLQDRHFWPQSTNWYKLGGRELVNSTLGIVGLGHIGRRIASLGRAFGMRVIATRHSAQPNEHDPDVDTLYPLSQLHTMLRQSDYVVLAVPLTKATYHMIGEPELLAMPSHAYLVNIARGHVINEKTLIHALQERWIAGAGLDVTEEEPLPANSPLFTMPNVILTPHISGVSVHYGERLSALFAENLRRYRKNMPLQNLYDPSRGY